IRTPPISGFGSPTISAGCSRPGWIWYSPGRWATAGGAWAARGGATGSGGEELLLESFDLRRPGRLGERRAAPNSLNEDAGRYERYQQSTHSRLLVRAGRIRDPAPGDGRLTGSW